MVILKCTIVPTTYPFMDYTKMYQAPEKYTFKARIIFVDFMHSAVILSVIVLNVVILSPLVLSAVMLSVVMMSVMPCRITT